MRKELHILPCGQGEVGSKPCLFAKTSPAEVQQWLSKIHLTVSLSCAQYQIIQTLVQSNLFLLLYIRPSGEDIEGNKKAPLRRLSSNGALLTVFPRQNPVVHGPRRSTYLLGTGLYPQLR